MNDIRYTKGEFQFIYRASALIYNKDRSKVLLFNCEGRDFYLLIGGKIHELEKSVDAVKREVLEEVGFDNIDFKFLVLSEEFVYDKGFNNQQLEIIYEGIYNDEIDKDEFKGLEGDWINLKWIDVDEVDKYNIYPKAIKDIIKSNGEINHIVEDYN